MWPFKKKATKPYARPPGWRARPMGQIFLAWRRHEITVWMLRYFAFCAAIFFVFFLLLFGGNVFEFFSSIMKNYGDLSKESGRDTVTMLPVMAIAFGLIQFFVFVTQLIQAKQHNIPHAMPKILTLVVTAYAILGLSCFCVWGLLNWFGAFWGLATFGVVIGMPLLLASLVRHSYVILFAIISGWGMFLWVYAFTKGYLDTPTWGLAFGATALLLLGIGICCAAWYRFRYCWSPMSEDFTFMESQLSLFSVRQRKFMRSEKEGWFSRWGNRERERRVERLCQTPPKTFWEQVRFFRIMSRPSRVGLSLFLAFLLFSPYYFSFNSDFIVFEIGMLQAGFSGIGIVAGIILVEWRSSFADESLLPMSRKRYVMAAGLGRFQNLLLFLIPYAILVALAMTIQASQWYTWENFVVAIFFAGMLSTMIPCLFLMAVYLPPYGFLIAIFFVIFFFAFIEIVDYHFLPFYLLIFMAIGAAMIPFGIWRLCRIEPGWIVKR